MERLTDMIDFLEGFLGLVMVLVVFGLGVFSFAVGVDYLGCRGFGNGTGYQVKYEWGCYANVNGRWVPSKFVFGEANELRIKEQK